MNRAALSILLLTGAAAAYIYRRNATDAPAAESGQIEAAPAWYEGYTDALPSLPTFDFWQSQNLIETQLKNTDALNMIDQNANIRAFLEAIARAEGTAGQPDPYRVCYSYKWTVQSLADHPALTGEWSGEKLTERMCKAAGFGPGCVSTAAGKYQITKPTWQRLKKKLKLTDFSGTSQDLACIELLREAGALEFVKAGNIAQAVQAARRTWASLPGAGYDQPERSLAWVQAQFTQAGGVLA